MLRKKIKTHSTLRLRLWLSYCSTERYYSSADTRTTASAEVTALSSAAPKNHALYHPAQSQNLTVTSLEHLATDKRSVAAF